MPHRPAIFTTLLLAVAGCEKPPSGGWGPVPASETMQTSRSFTVPANGQPWQLPLASGRTLTQPVPAADGTGLVLDGVGAFPGASFSAVVIQVDGAPQSDRLALRARYPFAAAAGADAVVDWYQRRMDAAGRDVQRDGQVLNGRTRDGQDWTLVLADREGGGSTGELRVRGTQLAL